MRKYLLMMVALFTLGVVAPAMGAGSGEPTGMGCSYEKSEPPAGGR